MVTDAEKQSLREWRARIIAKHEARPLIRSFNIIDEEKRKQRKAAQNEKRQIL